MVASDRQVMYWAPDKKTAVALKCLSTHSAVVQSFTSDTARAVAVYRSSGHAISQLLSRNKSVVSARAQVARSVASGGHSHSCGRLHSSAYRLIRYCTGRRVYAFR